MTEKHSFIILGTGGVFTFNVIQTLVKQNYKPVAYIQSGNNPKQNQTSFADIKLEILKPQSALTQLLKTQNIPVHYQSQIELLKFIKQQNVEFMLVACWPTLIPNKAIKAVSKAALNLHPSLLPRFRGIDPIGDQLNNNDHNFGISLHLISETYDTGDIVLQRTLNSKIDLDKSTLEIDAARKGANLFIQAINTHQHSGWELILQYKNQLLY